MNWWDWTLGIFAIIGTTVLLFTPFMLRRWWTLRRVRREYQRDLERARSPLLSIGVNLSPSRRGTERHLTLHLPGPDKILRVSQACYFNPEQARFVEAVALCPNIRIEHTE